MKIIGMILIGLLLFFAMYNNLGSMWQNHYDDSYITYRYAINLATGKGMVYNEGEKTDAATSFLYTVMLAASYRLGIHDLEVVGFLINLLSQLCIIVLVYLFVMKLTDNKGYAMCAGVCSGVHGLLSVWTVLGMETALFTAIMLSFVYSVLFIKNNILSTSLFILLCVTRPEGILFGVLLLRDRNSIIASLAVIGLFYVVRMWYYDTIIPHSVQIKFITTYTEYKRYLAPLSVFAVIAWTLVADKINSKYMMLVLSIVALISMVYVRPIISTLASQEMLQLKIGEYINTHIDTDEVILSSEIGGYGYKAINHRFIDGYGLTSSDVLYAYKHGESIDVVLNRRKPRYIADTYHEIGEFLYSKNMNTFDFLKYNIPESEYLQRNKKIILDFKADRNIHFVLLEMVGE